MFLKEVTGNEIHEIVSQFFSKTSVDYTTFSMAFVMQIVTYISLPFTSICKKRFMWYFSR